VLPKGFRRARNFGFLHPNSKGLIALLQVVLKIVTIKTYPDIRLLALHRILAAQLLNDAIAIPDGFNLDEYLASGALGWFPKEVINLEAAFSTEVAAHLYETPLAEDQVLTVLPDGRIKLTATIRETLQLRWWLQGFGDAVEVLAPSGLRQQIADNIQKLAARYASGSKLGKKQ
jgi:predicted DNA-binding transcriptional regulator YafY